MKKPRTDLGMRLRGLRLGMPGKPTHAEVAEAVGIARSYYSGIEGGTEMPGRETLAAIADFFGITIDYLQKGSPAPSKRKTREAIEGSDEFALLEFWDVIDDEDRGLLIGFASQLFDRATRGHGKRKRQS